MENQLIKILIMEDDELVRTTIYDYLILQNFDVLQAENGKIGYELAVKLKPDIIISDIMMPEMDGYEVLEKIKDNPVTADILFIFLSTFSGPAPEKLSIELGANYHMVKPFDPKIIIPIINFLIKGKMISENLKFLNY